MIEALCWSMDEARLEHLNVPTNGVHLHTVAAGPPDGPLVVLLHGFPEFWYGWRAQIPALAAAGYRVLALDQRGYNLSDKPEGIDAYTLATLGRDILCLLDAQGRDKAYLVGHDWGASVAWWLGTTHPERLERLAILNVPHPHVMMQTLRTNSRQLLKSWYVFFFQLPRVPEALVRRDDWRMLRASLVGSSHEGTFTDADLRRYQKAWSRPGAMTGMLNWYRALLQRQPEFPALPRVRVPTLVIWGAQDRFLSRGMARASLDLCDDGDLVFFEDATHWVQHEEAEQVNGLLLDFFGAGTTP